MRGVFFGTSDFAVPSLAAFAARVRCTLVVTQPDRPAGRGHKLQPTAVKRAAGALGIPTIEPDRLRDVLPKLAAADADLFAVASYGKIVPQAVLDLPRLGALNVHPSLLPLYRGATPLQAQLRDGVAVGGVTIIHMDAGMDTGDVALRRESPIGERETYGELHDRFAALGADLLARACELAAAGRLDAIAQADLAPADAIAATATRPLTKDDLTLDWAWPARRVVNHVRSLAPRPGARAWLRGEERPVKILEAGIAGTPRDGDLVVACGDGTAVVIDRLVPADRAPIDGRAYLQAALARGRAS